MSGNENHLNLGIACTGWKPVSQGESGAGRRDQPDRPPGQRHHLELLLQHHLRGHGQPDPRAARRAERDDQLPLAGSTPSPTSTATSPPTPTSPAASRSGCSSRSSTPGPPAPRPSATTTTTWAARRPSTT